MHQHHHNLLLPYRLNGIFVGHIAGQLSRQAVAGRAVPVHIAQAVRRQRRRNGRLLSPCRGAAAGEPVNLRRHAEGLAQPLLLPPHLVDAAVGAAVNLPDLVGIAVVRYGVSLPDLPSDLRLVVGAAPQEKGRADLLFGQDIQHPVGHGIVGAVVKGQVGDLLVALPRPDLLLQRRQPRKAGGLLLLDCPRQILLLLHLPPQGLHLLPQRIVFGVQLRQLSSQRLLLPSGRVTHPQPHRNSRHHHQHGEQYRQRSALFL